MFWSSKIVTLVSNRTHLFRASAVVKYPLLLFKINDEGNALLHLAIERGDFEAVKKIIEEGGCPLLYNQYDQRPLDLAAGYEDAKMFRYLMEASELCITDADRWSILAYAVVNCAYENVEWWFTNSADGNIVDVSSPHPLKQCKC